MADEAGGTNNKLTFTLDLDSNQFTLKMNDVEQKLGQMGHTGESSFRKLGEAALFLNEGLELVKKVQEVIHEGFEKMAAADKIKNQETAFKNLTSSIGANSDALMKSISMATDGTVTKVDAMKYSFELLNAGIRSDQIPTLMAYADKMEKASGGTKTMADMVHAVSMALETGATRGLRQFGLKITETGDRATTMNAILEQLKQKAEKAGDGYSAFGERMISQSKDMGNAITKWVGGALEHMLMPILGNDAEKATINIQKLKENLERVNKAAAQGAQDFVYFNGVVQKNLPIAEAQRQAAEALAAAEEKLHGIHAKESEELKSSIGDIGQKTVKNLALTDSQKKQVEVTAELIGAQRRLDEEMETSSGVQEKTLDALYKAKVNSINEEASLAKASAEAGASNAKRLQEKLIEIESERIEAIKSLRVSDEDEKKALLDSETAYFESHLLDQQGAVASFLSKKEEAENNDFKKSLLLLRGLGLAQDEYRAAVNEAEIEHQQKLLGIKQYYYNLSVQNLQIGFKTALKTMEADATDFSKISEKLTNKTKTIMVNSFVEAAKGHGDAMEMIKNQMLEALGTQMIEMGVFHLLAGIWPPNPIELGQGAALVAAGSALVGAGAGAGSGASGGGGGSYGGGGGTVGAGSGGGISQSPQPADQSQLSGKNATIVVNGNLMNSSDTADYLAELLRNNSDVKDFNIVSTGGVPYR